jgi:hypothetical protein
MNQVWQEAKGEEEMNLSGLLGQRRDVVSIMLTEVFL